MSYRFIYGTECDNTFAKGLKTLFIEGLAPVEDIESAISREERFNGPIKHLVFGCSSTFDVVLEGGAINYELLETWESTISHFLNKLLWCSLEFDVSQMDIVLESRLVENTQFIPKMTIVAPYIRQLRDNGCVKIIDGTEDDHINHGTWSHRIDDLVSHKHFIHTIDKDRQ